VFGWVGGLHPVGGAEFAQEAGHVHSSGRTADPGRLRRRWV